MLPNGQAIAHWPQRMQRDEEHSIAPVLAFRASARVGQTRTQAASSHWMHRTGTCNVRSAATRTRDAPKAPGVPCANAQAISQVRHPVQRRAFTRSIVYSLINPKNVIDVSARLHASQSDIVASSQPWRFA